MSHRLSRFWYASAAVLALILGASTTVFAQGATVISGRVTTRAAGTPISGVTVLVDGTQLGAVTNDQGQYTLTVPAGRTGSVNLTARLIGYRAMRQPVTLVGGRVAADFVLTSQPTQLTEVVVTALSQQREKATLGTAQQTVSAEELTRTQTTNVISAMSGKVAGLQISQSGNMGGSSRIVIRGAGSILGNNQPLFIIDGIPVSNANLSTANSGGGRDYGSAISDLNMDDVASVTVLKGPNAAALYGSRASNGAVVITTKNGRDQAKGTRFGFTSRATYDTPSFLPNYQNSYGQGFTGDFQYLDGQGGGVNDGADESWGPRLDGRLIDQFTGKQQPWIAHPNNVSNFFRSGGTLSNNVNVSSSFDAGGVRFSLTKDDTRGIVPNSSLNKLAGSVSANATLKEKLSVAGSVNYTQNAGKNRQENGYTEGNPLMSFTWFGRQVDLDLLKNQYYNKDSPYGIADGSLFNWNINYHRNPYWQQYENPAPDSRDRVIAQASANYEFTPWLSGMVRGGGDQYRFTRDEQFAAGNIDRADASYNGGFTSFAERNREANVDGLLTAKKSVGMFDLSANWGGNHRRNDLYRASFGTTGILVPGIYNLANAGIAPAIANSEFHSAVNSTYGSAVATMNRLWTVEVTGRNDWSSTLPKENASYFYPSVSSSLIISDLFPALTNNGMLTYLKLRGSWARVGSDADPYQLATLYNGFSQKFAGSALYTLSDQSANAGLKPEQTTGKEGGVEFSLYDDRITFDGSYYSKATRNQIIPLTIPPATGFTQTVINAGQISNKGIEMSITAKPIRIKNGFQWTSTVNYNKNTSKVDELQEGLTLVNIPGTGVPWSVQLQARVGEPYGQLYGPKFKRDTVTKELLLAGGFPQRASTVGYLGNVNPDWIGGWSNEFRYKSLALNALLDVRHGGSAFSIGNMWGTYAGILQESLVGREVDWDNPGLVVQGRDEASGKANTTNVTSEDYRHSIYPIAEPYVYNSGFVKLREVRLSWEVPSRLAAKARVAQMNIAFVGRNLMTWSSYPNYDPENASNTTNAQGFEMGGLPTTKSLGINLSITP
ncbi:MAG: SusC/RagA family TonB-linked outer membrane protein [Gemmatimonadaceae bacterium]